MSTVNPKQASFNGGEISRRLHGRSDQSIYAIATKEMTGFAPLVEGPAEAMPGTIHVAVAPGPCRLFRFEYNVTQGHALEFSDGLVRVYTNDALLTDGVDPIEVVSPYYYVDLESVKTHQSYDVLYCFHPTKAPQKFIRNSATDFEFADLTFENGPFEARNKDETLIVTANGISGTVELTASADLFVETDVGSLFKMEAEDLGDVPVWEPGITVAAGDLLRNGDNVYRVVAGGGEMRTGNVAPFHKRGVEWDGIGGGSDLNSDPAFGVQLEFVHSRVGIARIVEYYSTTVVFAEVIEPLPFSAVDTVDPADHYAYTGGYYDVGWGSFWTPPVTAVAHQYGTWRWAFGAFSTTRGWPEGGVIWNQRLILHKGSTIYASVTGDLSNFAELNELNEQSADMAFTYTIEDPNAILWLVPDDQLLILTASGVHALGPGNSAEGIGPTNVRVRRQNNAGASAIMPQQIDARTVYVDKSRARIYQADFDGERQRQMPEDLTRYARQIAKPGRRFVALAPQQQPFNHLWAVREDGTMACAAYLPEEEVLGFANRTMADGVLAKHAISITDPDGYFDQVWIVATYGGAWHVLRMAPWRHDGDDETTSCMMDMAVEHSGAATASASFAEWGEASIHVVADGAFYACDTDSAGAFTIPTAASHIWAGLPYPAAMESLDIEAGGDNGSSTSKKGRIVRSWMQLAASLGLRFGTPADGEQGGDMVDLEQLQTDSVLDDGFASQDGLYFKTLAGSHTRTPRLRIERVAPFPATVLAWGGELRRENL